MREPRVRQETVVLHGHRRAYRWAGPEPGTAPAVLLVHGIGDTNRTWTDVLPRLARTRTVVAPDLLGHGASDKPRADYSVGGFANGMRDLLCVLGIERATVVGHSLGGGVAQQLVYQYPQLCERLVLVASGGLGLEVNPLLRLAALPGASLAIGASVRSPVRLPVLLAARVAASAGLVDPWDVDEVTHVWSGLRDASTRSAFLRTLRGVIDLRGQSVTSADRLYLAARVPTLLVWGDRDPILPVGHARRCAALLPTARLEVVARAGHQPHRTDPERFVALLERFLDETAPAVHDPVAWRASLLTGALEPAPVQAEAG
ncbi:MAG: alpha/beta hydrolase fold protein [Frankiales bacterium]|nr:alpha/beta hydrolase fold protein [Frankiales bacterium]